MGDVMWIIVIAFLVNNQPAALFTVQNTAFDSQAMCEMQVDQAVAELQKELENDMVPLLTPHLKKGKLEGKCIVDESKPKEHSLVRLWLRD